MKKLKYLALPLVFLVLGSSCSLDETIYDQATASNAVKSEADLNYAVVGAYSHLNSINLFGRDLMFAFHPYADDISSVAGFEPGVFGRKQANSGHSMFNTIYTRFYATIKEAHALLNYADNVTTNEENRAKVKGEAYFLRAFCYFNLVQLYGGVPLITSAVDASSDFYPKRASVDEIYEQIFIDLKEASSSLLLRRDQPANEFYRATKAAADGYLSKAYLTYANYLDNNNRSGEARGFYQKAKDAADLVILSQEHSLVDDYGDLWDVNKEKANYKEVIFAIPHARDAATPGSTGEGSNFPNYFLPASYAGAFNGTVGAGHLRIQPWFLEQYTKGDYLNDYRVEKTFLTTWIGTNGVRRVCYPYPFVASDVKNSEPYLFKYVDPKGLGVFSHENDLYLLRLSDIYLMKAESENELNGATTEALTAFNKVRERARKANGIARTAPGDVLSGISKEDFRMKIFNERGLEFVGEYNRYFDLIRMRYKDNTKTMYEYQFGTFLPSLPQGLPVADAASLTWKGGKTQSSNLPAYNKKFLLWPIPANQMAINPMLIPQNPEW